MGTSTYRATGSSLSFDAFYADEFGRINDDSNTFTDIDDRKGFHKNKYTGVFEINGVWREHSNFESVQFKNQANPNINTNLKLKQHGCPSGDDLQTATFYFSNSVFSYWQQTLKSGKKWEVPINLTVLFAVGTELNRHGIRSFFEAQTNMQGIVVISGVEPPRDGPVRYGVSPSNTQLAEELNKMFSVDVAFKIKVLSAFSTGYCGLNICLSNDLLNVSDVERLIIYDCFYLSGADCSTVTAINSLIKKVDISKFKLLAYKCSQGGNSFADASKVELHPSLVSLFKNKQGLIENLYYNVFYLYLITHRSLAPAFEDRVISFPSPAFERAFNDLKILMPKRGGIISNLDTNKFVYGSNSNINGKTVFNDWAKQNAAALRNFGKFLGSKSDNQSIRGLLWQNRIPGWAGGDGEENHDLLIPEFGWEYLPY
jgi:hypothetical protein